MDQEGGQIYLFESNRSKLAIFRDNGLIIKSYIINMSQPIPLLRPIRMNLKSEVVQTLKKSNTSAIESGPIDININEDKIDMNEVK